LCNELTGSELPDFLDVAPRPDSIPSDCFTDAQKKSKAQGGSVQHGWLIWEFPEVMLEFEFHAVWRRPDGSLLDVSKKADNEKRILFVPDQTRTFKGARRPGMRHALVNDLNILEFIKTKH